MISSKADPRSGRDKDDSLLEMVVDDVKTLQDTPTSHLANFSQFLTAVLISSGDIFRNGFDEKILFDRLEKMMVLPKHVSMDEIRFDVCGDSSPTAFIEWALLTKVIEQRNGRYFPVFPSNRVKQHAHLIAENGFEKFERCLSTPVPFQEHFRKSFKDPNEELILLYGVNFLMDLINCSIDKKIRKTSEVSYDRLVRNFEYVKNNRIEKLSLINYEMLNITQSEHFSEFVERITKRDSLRLACNLHELCWIEPVPGPGERFILVDGWRKNTCSEIERIVGVEAMMKIRMHEPVTKSIQDEISVEKRNVNSTLHAAKGPEKSLLDVTTPNVNEKAVTKVLVSNGDDQRQATNSTMDKTTEQSKPSSFVHKPFVLSKTSVAAQSTVHKSFDRQPKTSPNKSPKSKKFWDRAPIRTKDMEKLEMALKNSKRTSPPPNPRMLDRNDTMRRNYSIKSTSQMAPESSDSGQYSRNTTCNFSLQASDTNSSQWSVSMGKSGWESDEDIKIQNTSWRNSTRSRKKFWSLRGSGRGGSRYSKPANEWTLPERNSSKKEAEISSDSMRVASSENGTIRSESEIPPQAMPVNVFKGKSRFSSEESKANLEYSQEMANSRGFEPSLLSDMENKMNHHFDPMTPAAAKLTEKAAWIQKDELERKRTQEMLDAELARKLQAEEEASRLNVVPRKFSNSFGQPNGTNHHLPPYLAPPINGVPSNPSFENLYQPLTYPQSFAQQQAPPTQLYHQTPMPTSVMGPMINRTTPQTWTGTNFYGSFGTGSIPLGMRQVLSRSSQDYVRLKSEMISVLQGLFAMEGSYRVRMETVYAALRPYEQFILEEYNKFENFIQVEFGNLLQLRSVDFQTYLVRQDVDIFQRSNFG